MKALVCELCNSNDIVKQDGFFVCQHCGTKYSLEEARKMILEINGPVEVKGTVTVDNSAQVENFLSMVKNAYESRDIDGVMKYTDKVLEIDPANYEAWVYRAKMACWGSSIDNPKLAQSYTAAKKAIELASEDKKTEVADEIYMELKKTVVALLTNSYKMPIAYAPTAAHKVMMMWNDCLTQIPNLSKELIDKELEDAKTACQNAKKAFLPNKRILYAAYVANNKGESYEKTFAKNLGL